MFRFVSSAILIAVVVLGAAITNQRYPHLKVLVFELLDNGQLHTLEAKFTAEQIMETHKRRLLKDSQHQFLAPETKFAPYLMMQVKYTESSQTFEGIILWDLLEGEMVVNTKNWEKTHGFGDCINAKIDKQEFGLIATIAERGGYVDRQNLLTALETEPELLNIWIESCRRKKLVVQSGSQVRLHIQKPKMSVKPETYIDDHLVTKTIKTVEKLTPRFRVAQIKKAAEAAFGADFGIRSTTNVFLPIYAIAVQNPDGSIHTSYWNALNGKELPFSSVIDPG